MAGTRLSLPSGSPDAVRQLPHSPGVYRFVDENGGVLYVGRAVDLRRRVASYWGALGDRRHLKSVVTAVKRVQAVVCASEHEAAWLERNLLEMRKPRANRTRGGQEVPTFIALSCDRVPRLKAVHSLQQDNWHYFGPYLGGDRVRLALSGLHRVYSLPYAGEDLTGSERDMARVRGITAGNRAERERAICAVLERQAGAAEPLRSELMSHRDRAAAALAFELASRIQDEISAVDWLASPQRVTALEPYDAEVYGWDNGHLVHFSVRAGRLSTWRQRPVGARRAAALQQATPAEWAEFAQENAALASRLAGASGSAP